MTLRDERPSIVPSLQGPRIRDLAEGQRLYRAIEAAVRREARTVSEVARVLGRDPAEVLEALQRFDRDGRIAMTPDGSDDVELTFRTGP